MSDGPAAGIGEPPAKAADEPVAKAANEKFAEAALVVLVERILSHEPSQAPITYKNLARLIAFPKPHTGSLFAGRIGKTLGIISAKLQRYEARGAPVPAIQSLVISKSTGVPGSGFAGCHHGYRDLPPEEKRRAAEQEQKRAHDFGRQWLDVLKQLDIPYQRRCTAADDGAFDIMPPPVQDKKPGKAVVWRRGSGL